MFSRRRGGWVNFELRNPSAKVVRFATTCISTSAESAGHFVTVRSTGKIAGVNDKVKASPQTVRDGSSQVRKSSR
jgi:hypothetical protein